MNEAAVVRYETESNFDAHCIGPTTFSEARTVANAHAAGGIEIGLEERPRHLAFTVS